MDWKLNIWGVRGSMPAPSRNFLDYGGNTSCVSVDCGAGDLVVFDAGSGLPALAGQLSGSCPVHIFISHVHIDHLLGLYTFPLFHTPGAEAALQFCIPRSMLLHYLYNPAPTASHTAVSHWYMPQLPC